MTRASVATLPMDDQKPDFPHLNRDSEPCKLDSSDVGVDTKP